MPRSRAACDTEVENVFPEHAASDDRPRRRLVARAQPGRQGRRRRSYESSSSRPARPQPTISATRSACCIDRSALERLIARHLIDGSTRLATCAGTSRRSPTHSAPCRGRSRRSSRRSSASTRPASSPAPLHECLAIQLARARPPRSDDAAAARQISISGRARFRRR